MDNRVPLAFFVAYLSPVTQLVIFGAFAVSCLFEDSGAQGWTDLWHQDGHRGAPGAQVSTEKVTS